MSEPQGNPTEDLVSRLRAKAAKGGVIPIHDMTLTQAADTIERLRGALEKERQRYESLADLKARRGKDEAAEEFWAKAEAIAEVLKS